MNHILTIHTDDEHNTEIVKLHIGSVNPQTAAITVLKALQEIQPARKQRSDAGKPRSTKPPTQKEPNA